MDTKSTCPVLLFLVRTFEITQLLAAHQQNTAGASAAFAGTNFGRSLPGGVVMDTNAEIEEDLNFFLFVSENLVQRLMLLLGCGPLRPMEIDTHPSAEM